MREILFKAKRVDNGGWIYGYLLKNINGDCAIQQEINAVKNGWWLSCVVYPVIPETVGQFTGLTDKNGMKIFEGDILNVAGDLIPVKYLDGSFHIIALINQGRSPLIDDRAKRTKVIGNIHNKK